MATPVEGFAPPSVNLSATATSPGHTVNQYARTFDDGGFSLVESPAKKFRAPGIYNVRLPVLDNVGNTVTKTLPITVTSSDQVAR